MYKFDLFELRKTYIKILFRYLISLSKRFSNLGIDNQQHCLVTLVKITKQ